MKNSLIILSDSMVTDIYINIITLCIKKFDIREVILLHICSENNDNNRENILYSKIIEQLKYILRGKYNLYNNSTGGYTLQVLEGYNSKVSEYYEKPYQILLDHINENSISLNEFYSYLESLKGKKDFIFDVTTLKKDILTNLVPVFIENNIINDIYYFKKNTPFKHNQSDLIHNLQYYEIKYDKLFDNRTLDYLIKVKKRNKKNIILCSCVFIILICLFIFISLGLHSKEFSNLGTIITIISFVLYLCESINNYK